MATNDFKPLAIASGSNVIDLTDYDASSTLSTGFVSGIALSNYMNRALRQGTVIASMIGAFNVQEGYNANDDGNTTTLLANYTSALNTLITNNTTVQTALTDATSALSQITTINGEITTINSEISTINTNLALKANIASPVFTGTPQAPTPATSDNSTDLATTAFVKNQGYAPLASPAFTGTPTAPTPSTGDNSTDIATTAFVKAQGYAPLASPAFTGTPTAPTQSGTSNNTDIATTAMIQAALYAMATQSSQSPSTTGNWAFIVIGNQVGSRLLVGYGTGTNQANGTTITLPSSGGYPSSFDYYFATASIDNITVTPGNQLDNISCGTSGFTISCAASDNSGHNFTVTASYVAFGFKYSF